MDLETTAAMAGKLGDAGIQGSEAGTALRAVLLQLSGATPQAQKVLHKLGVSVKDANGNMRAVPEILSDLDEAMRGFGTAQRAEMTKTIRGTEAMSAATVRMAQAGTGSLQEYAKSLHETGSAARVAAKINDNTAGALKTLGSRAEALAISLGTLLLPALTDMIGQLIPGIDHVNAWADANPAVIRGLALAAAVLFGMRGALLGIRLILQPLIMAYYVFNGLLASVIWVAGAAMSTFAFLGRAMLLLGRVARGAAASGLRVLGGAIRFVGRSLVWAGRVALANPIIAVLTLIAVAAYAIYENWDGFVAYFEDKIDRVRAAFDVGLINGVWAVLSEFNPFRMALDGAIALAKFLWEKLDAGTRALVSGAWGVLKEFNPFKAAMDGAIALARYLWDTLTQAFDIDLFEKGVAMINSLKDGIWSVLTGMVEAIKAKLQSIVPGWMMDAWNWVKGDEQPAPATAGVADQPQARGGRATGGPVRAGMIYRWLEEGQEMFSPAVDGNVISNRQLRGMRQGGGRSMSISLGGVVIHAAPGQSPMDIARAVRAEVERLISESGALHDGGEYAG
ncbi:phage tail tape measure protein, partial [Thioclava sp.]|uniref:phage tail tape measure protein n=1 Tax=Thioclava sp. TaxID=1933450 RepID=UPI003241EB2F